MKKTRVVVCDDELDSLRDFQKMLDTYFMNLGIPYEIVCYTSSKTLWDSNEFLFDLIFLDVFMPAPDGFELAEKLRERNRNFTLVYMSRFNDFVPRGYLSRPLLCLRKDQLVTMFEKNMDLIVDEMGLKKAAIEFRFLDYGVHFIHTDDLIYLESKDRHVYFHLTEGQTMHLKAKLIEIARRLPEEEFLRIHKSFLVNRQYVNDIRNYRAFLYDGQVLSVPPRWFDDAKHKFYMYRGRLWTS